MTAQDTDALLFETLVRDGRRAHADGDPQGAARLLSEALDLWHGRPLADVPPTPLVHAEAERLSELRLGALELRFTAELALDRHDQAVAELGRLVADHPLREGLWLLLMRALDGAGLARRGARGLRPGPGCHLRSAGRGPRCRAAAVPRRTAGQGQRRPGRSHLCG